MGLKCALKESGFARGEDSKTPKCCEPLFMLVEPQYPVWPDGQPLAGMIPCRHVLEGGDTECPSCRTLLHFGMTGDLAFYTNGEQPPRNLPIGVRL